jgi:hypothetical protein
MRESYVRFNNCRCIPSITQTTFRAHYHKPICHSTRHPQNIPEAYSTLPMRHEEQKPVTLRPSLEERIPRADKSRRFTSLTADNKVNYTLLLYPPPSPLPMHSHTEQRNASWIRAESSPSLPLPEGRSLASSPHLQIVNQPRNRICHVGP